TTSLLSPLEVSPSPTHRPTRPAGQQPRIRVAVFSSWRRAAFELAVRADAAGRDPQAASARRRSAHGAAHDLCVTGAGAECVALAAAGLRRRRVGGRLRPGPVRLVAGRSRAVARRPTGRLP